MVKNPVFRKITPGMDKWATPDTRSLRSTAQDLRRQNNPSIRPFIMEGDIRGSEYLNSVRKIEKLSTSAWKKKSMYTILIGCLSISDARQPEVDFLHS